MLSIGTLRDLLGALIIVLVLSGYAAYNHSLPASESVELAAHEDLPPMPGRKIQHVTLHTKSIGDIGLAISLPDPAPAAAMPIVFVLGGLDTGEHNISQIPNAGNNVIVGYDWPMRIGAPNSPAFLKESFSFYRNAMNVPAQIASSLNWITSQSWTDASRISVLGYSMGALAAPAAEDVNQQIGHPVQWTILAYGGAPLSDLIMHDDKIQPTWMRYVLAPLVKLMFHPLEPADHLPNLSGSFLVIEGKDDQLISESARLRLREAVPQPRRVVVLDGEHMGVGDGKDELLQKIIDASRNWLVQEEAVNPL